jgi:hypothetical protein
MMVSLIHTDRNNIPCTRNQCWYENTYPHLCLNHNHNQLPFDPLSTKCVFIQTRLIRLAISSPADKDVVTT